MGPFYRSQDPAPRLLGFFTASQGFSRLVLRPEGGILFLVPMLALGKYPWLGLQAQPVVKPCPRGITDAMGWPGAAPGLKGTVIRRVPVPGIKHGQVLAKEGGDDPVEGGEDQVPSRDAEGTARHEIILDVDHQQGVVRFEGDAGQQKSEVHGGLWRRMASEEFLR